MAKISFTAGRVMEFTCPTDKQQAFLWDSKAPGLGIRATQGAKSYIYQGKFNSQSIRITIGDIKTWTIQKAQSEARRLQAMVDQGKDPRQQKVEQIANDKTASEKAKTEAMRNTITVQIAWDEYIEMHSNIWGVHHLLDHKKTSQEGGQPKKRSSSLTTQGALYPVLQIPMAGINAEVLTTWQKQEAKTRPASARHAFVLFKTFWTWASQHKKYGAFIDINATTDRGLRRQVPTAKTKKFDVLQRAHLSDWFAAIRNLTNPIISAYLQGLILTGARREELAELKWEHIDFKLGAIWIKDKIEDEGRMIPLTPYFLSLIIALPRRNQWVFNSPTSKDGKLAEPRIAHNRALSIAGLEHVTIHGLRRTFASLAEWVEMPTGVVAQIMGHAPNATAEKHYKNRPLELLAIWHTKYEAWILEQAGIQFSHSNPTESLRIVK